MRTRREGKGKRVARAILCFLPHLPRHGAQSTVLQARCLLQWQNWGHLPAQSAPSQLSSGKPTAPGTLGKQTVQTLARTQDGGFQPKSNLSGNFPAWKDEEHIYKGDKLQLLAGDSL